MDATKKATDKMISAAHRLNAWLTFISFPGVPAPEPRDVARATTLLTDVQTALDAVEREWTWYTHGQEQESGGTDTERNSSLGLG